jgi:hypothetical protein
MGSSNFKIFFALLASFAVITAMLLLAGPEDIAAFSVALACGAIGLGGLALLRDTNRRLVVLKLFTAAYLLRLVFTLFFYKSGAAELLGGGDEIIWEHAWQQSLYWVHGEANPYMADAFIRSQTANSLIELYDGSVIQNTGYRFFATYLFYVINVPSQMALSILNCFFNALTVVIIYQFAREFFSHRASQFAALVALFLPGYLVWSALTVKETWLILLEIGVLFILWRLTRSGNTPKAWLYGALIGLIIVFMYSLRFYVAWMLAPVVVLAFFALRSPRPLRTIALCIGGSLVLYVVLMQLGLMPFDLMSVGKKMLLAMSDLRESIGEARAAGGESVVRIDYDVTTARGFVMMFFTGVTYLLFAPFPWQFLSDASMRQLLVLPESLLWYGLIFIFMGPGLVECWRYHKPLFIGIVLFITPLILIYSLSFANIGLVYRQRAQLMPFFLLIIAAGHESLSRRRLQRSLQGSLQEKAHGKGYGYGYRYGRAAYGYYSADPVPAASAPVTPVTPAPRGAH